MSFPLTSTPCAWSSRSWTKPKRSMVCGRVPGRTMVTSGIWTIVRPKYLIRQPWNAAVTTSGRSPPFPWERLQAWVVLVHSLTRVRNWSGLQSTKKLRNSSNGLVVVSGCSLCLVLVFVANFLLLLEWIQNRTSILYLKIQCCTSIMGAMIVFVFANVGTFQVVSNHRLVSPQVIPN